MHQLSFQSTAHLHRTNTLTISQALFEFEKTLKRKHNYLRIVKQYLHYCIAHHLPINDFSVASFTTGKKSNIASPVRKFLRFAQERHLERVVADPPKSKIPPAANELVLGYLSSAKNLRGKKSKVTYTNILNAFFKYLQDHQLGFFFPSVTAYIDDLLEQHKSAFTINAYLSVIKQLTKWVVINRHSIPYDFSQDQIESLRDIAYIRGLAVERTYYKDALTEKEREYLLYNIVDVRWQAIVSLMAYCGLRSVEVPRIRVGDVDFERKTLRVKGKGKYTYELIKLFDQCASCLKKYFLDNDYFAGSGKTALLFEGLDEIQVQYHTKKFLAQAGLSRDKLSTHSLRHTAGQLLIDQGVNPAYVQQQLRHLRFETTEFYVSKQLKKTFLSRLPDQA